MVLMEHSPDDKFTAAFPSKAAMHFIYKFLVKYSRSNPVSM